MKNKFIVSMLLFCFAVFLAASSFGQENKTSESAAKLKTVIEEPETDDALTADDADDAIDEATEGDPEIFTTETEYKFPTVLDGVQITHDFTVLNKGNAELRIKKVKTG